MRQTNFGGGEIAPMSWGRSDRSFFGRGLRTMRNFFPTKQHGAAVSRPGSLYLGQTRSNVPARLLPFVYSDDSSFCLEVGLTATRNVYFRFWSDGSLLQARYLPIDTVAAGTLRVGDTITGAGGGGARILSISKSIFGHTQVQVGAENGTPFNAGETYATTGGASGLLLDSVSAGTLELQSGVVPAGFELAKLKHAQTGAVMILTHPDWPVQELRRLDNVGNQPYWTLGDFSFRRPYPFFDPASVAGTYPVAVGFVAPDPTHPAREWTWLVTQIVQETATGRVFETGTWVVSEQWDGNTANLPTALDTPALVPVYPDMPVTIQRGLHLDGPTVNPLATEPGQNVNFANTSYRVIACNVYRGRGELFGFVGTFDGETFTDVGAEPDYATPPPRSTQPFRITDYAGASVTENPGALAFFQEKLFFGGTPRRASGVWASATGDYPNFDLNQIVHSAGESLYFELASRRFEQLVHLVTHQKLIIGTKSSVWSFSGAQGGVLDFDSVDARVIDEVGMTDLPPLIVEGIVLFARTKGAGVRALEFDGQVGSYGGTDISGQSDHLFVGSSVGAVGAATNKAIVDWTYAEDPWGLIWAVRADGMLLSLTIGAEGAYGWARHDGSATSLSAQMGYGTPAAYKAVCAVPEGDEDAVYVIVQRAIAGSGGVYCVERMTSRVRRGTAYDDGCVDCGVLVNQPVPSLNIAGLGHLEGERVYVCAKGNAPQGPFTVQGGAIELAELPEVNSGLFSVVLYVGLLYTPDLELLDVVAADSRLKQKTVARVGWELDQSSGVQVGQDFEHLSDSRPHTVESGWDAPVPGTQVLAVNPVRKWDTGGRACLRQSLPLPVTVVGAVRELEIGG